MWIFTKQNLLINLESVEFIAIRESEDASSYAYSVVAFGSYGGFDVKKDVLAHRDFVLHEGTKEECARFLQKLVSNIDGGYNITLAKDYGVSSTKRKKPDESSIFTL